MDKLLCLLEKYRCHLKRGNKTSAEFLNENYSEYINDVREALTPEDNQLVGAEMCRMVSEQIDSIEKNANLLVEVLELYNKGKIVSASHNAFEVFENMKPILMQSYSG
ncbi:MAG: hypothetical protein Q4F11_10185, partial [Eubacteriales bacterium]|nr:hypothetical protein [Eubacteriales bacterium]